MYSYSGLQVSGKVREVMGEEKLDAVVCVAGGWAGGNAASPGVSLSLSLCMCNSSTGYIHLL